MTSLEIKHALMWYFRFKRQWLCATECLCNDVMAITDKDIIEVEIKINKYDLWKGEAKKDKHEKFRNPFYSNRLSSEANRFYICVPRDLIEEAEKWVEATNSKYGIIQCHPDLATGFNIFISKTARTLHDKTTEGLKESIMMRVCSENIGLIETILERKS